MWSILHFVKSTSVKPAPEKAASPISSSDSGKVTLTKSVPMLEKALSEIQVKLEQTLKSRSRILVLMKAYLPIEVIPSSITILVIWLRNCAHGAVSTSVQLYDISAIAPVPEMVNVYASFGSPSMVTVSPFLFSVHLTLSCSVAPQVPDIVPSVLFPLKISVVLTWVLSVAVACCSEDSPCVSLAGLSSASATVGSSPTSRHRLKNVANNRRFIWFSPPLSYSIFPCTAGLG